MAKLDVLKNTADVTIYIFIQNSSLTTGAGLTGLVFNSASLVCYYVRPLAAAAALSLVTQTVTGAHSDGGFVEVNSANMPGLYRLDLSDAVCATGVNSVVVMLKGATNMAPVLLEIQLTSYNPNDAVRLGLTALPNAAADAAGGLIISDAGGLDADAQRSDIAAILVDTGTTLDDLIDDLETRLGTPSDLGSGATIAANLIDIEGQTDDIGVAGAGLTALGDVRIANLDATVSSRSTVTTAQVNAEVVDALAVDTYAELAAVPAATSSLKDKINWIFALARNKIIQTSSLQSLRNDADGGNISTAVVSDDNTTATRNEWQ